MNSQLSKSKKGTRELIAMRTHRMEAELELIDLSAKAIQSDNVIPMVAMTQASMRMMRMMDTSNSKRRESRANLLMLVMLRSKRRKMAMRSVS